jgi:hypothetical protein
MIERHISDHEVILKPEECDHLQSILNNGALVADGEPHVYFCYECLSAVSVTLTIEVVNFMDEK